MRYVILLYCLCLPVFLKSQQSSIIKNDSTIKKSKILKPEIFTSGFIDIVNSGQISASARFVRLMIGEPNKFSLPLCIYGGVTNNSFQNQSYSGNIQRSNDQLVTQFINPLTGLINISIEGVKYFKNTTTITKTALLYHIGERVLTGYKSGSNTTPSTGKPVNFVNSFSSLGFYFQTGAWEKNNVKNEGIFWIAAHYHLCYSSSSQIKEFLPTIATNGIYAGYSVGFGVEISNVINLKAIYYKYTKAPEIEYNLPIYQFSFNYSLKN